MSELVTTWKERAKKIAPMVGFPIFYLACLVLFASWTFPYEKLKDRIVVSFNAQQRATGSPEELSIDTITSSWITGIKMKGIRLTSPSPEPGKPPSELKVDEATARIALFPLLVGNKDIGYKVSAFGGKIDGFYDDRGKDRALEVNFDEVDVGQVTPLTDLVGLPMTGALSGTIKLEMPEGKPSMANGVVALDLKDMSVGDGKAKLKGALALPKVAVGTLSFAGEAKEGVMRITKFGASGKDIDLSGDGRVQMRELAMESGVDVNVKFKVNDAYRTKSDVTKSLFGAPGSNVPGLFELADAKVKQAKRPDGFYAWHVRGQLGHPDFVPAAAAFNGGAPVPTAPHGLAQ